MRVRVLGHKPTHLSFEAIEEKIAATIEGEINLSPQVENIFLGRNLGFNIAE